MGFAPGDGPISRLGNRAEKHAIRLLSVVRLLFFEIGCSGRAVSGSLLRRTGERCSLLFALSLAFFSLATLSKPSVVMLPVVLFLCIWWRTGRPHLHDVVALAPFVLISAASV